ncbi:hypothetical protein C8T65DRAFT_746769 [Cerioporus squamosus]|nr:hypothetical protein C8T65DRAFT_746769 [Cerioporus squamosus]
MQLGKVKGHHTPQDPDPVLGIHSDFESTLPALELLHVNINLGFRYQAHKLWYEEEDIQIPAHICDSYRRFISSAISALRSARSLRFFSFKLLFCFSKVKWPLRSAIIQLLFYEEMQEQLKAISSDALIAVVLEDWESVKKSGPFMSPEKDSWPELISTSLPVLHDQLHIRTQFLPMLRGGCLPAGYQDAAL